MSPEPVLTAEIAGLARAVADRYGGTLADVLRLAIPPRHAAAESAAPGRGPAPPSPPGPAPRAGTLGPLPGGPVLPHRAGRRAARRAPPGPRCPARTGPSEIARAAAAARAAGNGALIVVPDARDLGLVDGALAGVLGPGQHVCLAAGLGPAERYRRWLTVARGQVRVVAGTRSAMFAPVADLGLVVIWDDGDDLHAEPRAPYPHVREVLALRAHRRGAAALLGGFARTTEVTQLVASGWAAALTADRDTVRRWAPRITAAGDDAELARDEAARSARMPSLALRTAREALARGPVLFQVPRRGYVVAVACERCGARARCPRCGGPLSLPAARAAAVCGWCGEAAGTRCPGCGQAGLRALVVGAGRTAEELGRAFPAAAVRTSGGAEVIAEVGGAPAVIVATPGAEPRAAGGYAAAVLLDGWALLGRASLRASEEALRRWLNAAALVRPGREGGSVVVVADAALPPVQALVRWDPVTHAERELAERQRAPVPPGGPAGLADRGGRRRPRGGRRGRSPRGRARCSGRFRRPAAPSRGTGPARPGRTAQARPQRARAGPGRPARTGRRSRPRCAPRRQCAAPARTRAWSGCSLTRPSCSDQTAAGHRVLEWPPHEGTRARGPARRVPPAARELRRAPGAGRAAGPPIRPVTWALPELQVAVSRPLAGLAAARRGCRRSAWRRGRSWRRRRAWRRCCARRVMSPAGRAGRAARASA